VAAGEAVGVGYGEPGGRNELRDTLLRRIAGNVAHPAVGQLWLHKLRTVRRLVRDEV